MTRTIDVIVKVPIPEKATHYHGDLLDHPSFYYCSQVGVAGDHWWVHTPHGWVLSSHHQPHWIKELSK